MKVSIVIPVYNAEKYLRKAVASAVTQDFTDWELILVDDGSRDGSGALCDELAVSDSRIRVFHTPNGGVTAARSFGVAQACGEWIAFVDADDTLLPSALTVMLAKSAGCDVVIGNKQIVTRSGATEEVMNTVDAQLTPHDFLADLITNRVSQFITGRIFRRSLFEGGTVSIPRELVMAEDFIMNVQLGNKARRVALITDLVYGYHVYDESVSHTFRTSLAYEAMFCCCLEEAVAAGPYADGLKEALAFQNVRALKAAFMAQRGRVDLRDPFVRRTRRQARTVPLTRGWRLFLWLLPIKRLGYCVLRAIDK